jgi:hypothetical protein
VQVATDDEAHVGPLAELGDELVTTDQLEPRLAAG